MAFIISKDHIEKWEFKTFFICPLFLSFKNKKHLRKVFPIHIKKKIILRNLTVKGENLDQLAGM